jgi:hypothetical protein
MLFPPILRFDLVDAPLSFIHDDTWMPEQGGVDGNTLSG